MRAGGFDVRHACRRVVRSRRLWTAALGVAALVSALLVQTGGRPAAASTLPPRFTDSVVLSGLTAPTVMAFSPDGRIFVGQKNGVIKVFSSLTDTTPVTVADLSSEVDNYNGGLLGLALPPDFPADPHLYVLYSFDGPIGGSPGLWNDKCPTPPGPTTDGCTVSGRLSRLTLSGNTMTGSEQVLVQGWCDQFPTHNVGTLFFGKDGDLYASGGDGASYTSVDYGQLGGTYAGDQANPCGDPPGGVGTALTPPTAEGGALRAQSVRRTDGPALLNGTVIRVDPATGAGVPGNPFYSSTDPNAQRIVAYGMRNPFRITQRPGTDELWIGDVGWGTWEEIDRVVSPAEATAPNFGWPCYEGNAIQPSYQATGLDLCSSLYAAPGSVTPPYYAYNHSGCVVTYPGCPTGGASITGMAFYEGGSYPSAYDGALFFADHTRKEIWVMLPGSNGLPDPTKVESFVGADATGAAAGHPVDLTIGPGGDLFYVDLEDGTIHRITYDNQPPTASLTASTTDGPAPLQVDLDASGSSDPEGRALTYSWDLDGDGTYGDATGPTVSHTFGVGVHDVSVQVTDPQGNTSTASVSITGENTAPTPAIDSPLAGTTWKVGDSIGFSGHATDAQDGNLPDTALDWTLVRHRCDSQNQCDAQVVASADQVATGSVTAPDCVYPCWLELQLTATDSGGLSTTTSLRLDPKTVRLRFRTNLGDALPVSLTVNGVNATPPFSVTAVVGSANAVTAPARLAFARSAYRFTAWSDGGGRTHTVVAPATRTTYTAKYRPGCWTTRPTLATGSPSCTS